MGNQKWVILDGRVLVDDDLRVRVGRLGVARDDDVARRVQLHRHGYIPATGRSVVRPRPELRAVGRVLDGDEVVPGGVAAELRAEDVDVAVGVRAHGDGGVELQARARVPLRPELPPRRVVLDDRDVRVGRLAWGHTVVRLGGDDGVAREVYGQHGVEVVGVLPVVVEALPLDDGAGRGLWLRRGRERPRGREVEG